jgi:hypothetical protein
LLAEKPNYPVKKTVKLLFTSLLGVMALMSHCLAQPVLVTNAPAAGTFYLLSVHPSLPHPFDPYFGMLPVYAYDGVFFVDDTQAGDLQMQQNGFGGEMMTSSLSGPGEGGSTNSGPLTNICSGPTNSRSPTSSRRATRRPMEQMICGSK